MFVMFSNYQEEDCNKRSDHDAPSEKMGIIGVKSTAIHGITSLGSIITTQLIKLVFFGANKIMLIVKNLKNQSTHGKKSIKNFKEFPLVKHLLVI